MTFLSMYLKKLNLPYHLIFVNIKIVVLTCDKDMIFGKFGLGIKTNFTRKDPFFVLIYFDVISQFNYKSV